jgi:hypothetical protein
LLTADGAEYVVTELAEGGLRLLAPAPPQRDGIVCGVLRGTSGHEAKIVGLMLREEGDEIVLYQLRGVSFAFVLEEQRRLLKRYPSVATK